MARFAFFPSPNRSLPVLLCLLLGSSLTAQARADEIRVVASIKPLALIARELLGDEGQVEVLLPGSSSPHDYALKVSDRERLRKAHLVLWMGPDLETFLSGVVDTLPPKRVLALGPTEGDSEEDHADPHRWLDPELAAEMTRAVAAHLEGQFPQRREHWEARLAQQLEDYRALDRALEEKLAGVREKPFVVQHRAYDYLVAAYGLKQVGWLSESPEQSPGLRNLYRLRRDLEEAGGGACLFLDASHQNARSRKLAGELNLRPQPLDLLGEMARSYPELMQNLADNIVGCLSD